MESGYIIFFTIWLGIVSYVCLYLWYLSTKIVDAINNQNEKDERELIYISVNYQNKDNDSYMRTKIVHSYREFAKWLEEVQDQPIVITYISIKEG